MTKHTETIRTHKDPNAPVAIDRTGFSDKRLTWAEFGLLAYLAILPEAFDVSDIEKIVPKRKPGDETIDQMIAALVKCGYVVEEGGAQ